MPSSFTKKKYSDIAGKLIATEPGPELKYIVVIPSFAETSLLPTLESIKGCQFHPSQVEIIILINEPDGVADEYHKINEAAYHELNSITHDPLVIHCLYITDIPVKISGVGNARKLAMDEASDRLRKVGRGKDGIIINLDADCTVTPNYFEAIDQFFKLNPKIELANIHFEHDLESIVNEKALDAIISYELHLRYFIGMQQWLGLPYAFQTIGSAFAVRAEAYGTVGGMSKRKAGEDFYFIHKFSKKGTIGNLHECTVLPSGRSSFRVPFGTGKAVSQILNSEQVFKTYHPQSFIEIEPFVNLVRSFYSSEFEDLKSILESPILEFLKVQDFEQVLLKLKSNSRSYKTFQKAFFQWFDAFRLMKYLHFVRDNYFDNIEVDKACRLTSVEIGLENQQDRKGMLQQLRSNAKRHVSKQPGLI